MTAQNIPPSIIHATAISIKRGALWRGVLISGSSGVGKSDLALRCLARGFNLICDDYCQAWLSDNIVYVSAPQTIKDKIEVRGIGIMHKKSRHFTRIDLIVHCQNTPIERLPEPEVTAVLGVKIPTIRLNPKEASCVDKLLIRLIG